MITLFRHSNPVAIIALLILACFPHFLFPYHPLKMDASNDPSIFSVQFNELFGTFFTTRSFWNGLISTTLILIEAFGLNKILGNVRLFEKTGFLPSLCFILLTNLIPYPYMGQMLVVNGALLLSLNYIIWSFKKEKANRTILLAGFFAGTAAGFNNNYAIFIWLSIAFFAMRPASLREWLLSGIGFMLPFYFMFSILYLSNKIDPAAMLQMPLINFKIPTLGTVSWIRIIAFITIAIIGMITSIQSMRKLLIQARKTLVISYQLFFIALFACIISTPTTPYNLYLMILPVSILIISVFTTIKRQVIPNLIMILMIILSMQR